MRAQFFLELKKQSRSLIFVIWVAIMFAFMLLGFRELSDTHFSWYSFDNAKQVANGTETSEQAILLFNIQHEMKLTQRLKKVDWTKQTAARYYAQRDILAAAKHHDYMRVNRIVTTAEDKFPELLKISEIIPDDFQTSFGQDRRSVYYSTKYLVRHRKKYTLEIAGFASVLPQTFAAMKYFLPIAGSAYELLALLITIGAIGMLFTVFFKDIQERTKILMLISPLKNEVQAGIRAVVTISLLNLLVASVFALVVSLLSLTPGHPFGDVAYPFKVLIQGEYVTNPLWLIFLRYLLLVNLWFILLASIAFCLSNLVHNQLIGMAVAAVVAFAQPLHLLALLPPAAARFMPGYYTNFVQITLHNNEFTDISLPTITAVFLVWTAVFWLIGSAVMTLRQHKYISALA